MTPEQERKRAARHERKRQRLGASSPACALCGYNRVPSLVEWHHIAAKANNLHLVVALCRNHHGELSDTQEDWPRDLRRRDPHRDPLLQLSAMCRGLVDFQRLLDDNLDAWADWLEAASAYLVTTLGEQWWTKLDIPSPL